MTPPARRLANVVTALAWLGTAVAAGWVAFAYLLPQNLANYHRVYATAATLAFYGRVFTFHAGLGLLLAAVWATLARRWRLLAVSAVAALAILIPTGYACRPRTPPASIGSSLRLMQVNLEYDNPNPAAVPPAVRSVDPDVIVFEEYTDAFDAALTAALGPAYPYRFAQPRLMASGLAIYAKQPFAEPPVARMDYYHTDLRVVLTLGGRPVVLYGVHPRAPHLVNSISVNRRQTLDYIAQFHAEHDAVILAGDFNFTAETPNAVALTRAGLTDAYDQANPGGRGSTWPVQPRWRSHLPGVRIDHVYLPPGLTATRYATGPFDGSDHLPIVVDVATAR